MSVLQQLANDQHGTSLTECAIVAPVLIVLACVTVDISMGVAQKLKDQQAADQAINYASKAGISTATPSAIQSEAASAAGVPISNVAVSMWVECNGVVESSGVCATGSPARYASVSISDSYRLMFGGILPATAIPLSGYAEVRLQ